MTKIYPAIDIINGACVRLTEGKEALQTNYHVSPLEMARLYQDAGAKYVHIVDLDAALGNGNNQDIIKEIIIETDLKIQLGGGIRSHKQIESLLQLGVERIIIGSHAVKQKAETKQWIKNFGSNTIVIGADVSQGQIVIDGWKHKTTESIIEFVQEYVGSGAQNFLCTDISKDGKLEGASKDLYVQLMTQFPKAGFLVSGGIHTLSEIQEYINMDMEGIIIGKAIYEGKMAIHEIQSLC